METPEERRYALEQLFLAPSWADIKLPNYRFGAVVVGDFFEEATSELFSCANARRLVTDSTCEVCPDLHESKREEYFIESKASGTSWSRYFKLFKHNITGYGKFLKTYWPSTGIDNPDWEPTLLFAFWTHAVYRVGDHKYRDELRNELANSVRSLHIVDFNTVNSMCALREPKIYRSFGRGHTGEGMYALRHTELKHMETDWRSFLAKWGVPQTGHVYLSCNVPNLTVYGKAVKEFPVHILIDGHASAKQSLTNFIQNLK